MTPPQTPTKPNLFFKKKEEEKKKKVIATGVLTTEEIFTACFTCFRHLGSTML